MKLAEMLSGDAAGQAGDVEIVQVSAVTSANPRTLVFASDAATLGAAVASEAGAILASQKLQGTSTDPRIVWVRDPRYSFSAAAGKLRIVRQETQVHASAVLGLDVRLGQGCVISPGVVIEDGVFMGASCVVGPRVTICSGTEIGDRVVVQAGAVLGSTGFGYARNPETGRYVLFPQQGRLVIGNDVEIGANTTIDRGALGETRIGAGTKIDNLVHIGHNCTIGRDVIIAAQTGISGSSVIENGAILGGQVGIGDHATVGAGVILGGGAGVLTGKKMTGSGQVFWGRPARPLKEYLRDLARLRRG